MKTQIKKLNLLILALTCAVPQFANASDLVYKKTGEVRGGTYLSNGEIDKPVSFCEYQLDNDAAVEGQLSVSIRSDDDAHVDYTFFIPKGHYPLVEGDSFTENGAVMSFSRNVLTSNFILQKDPMVKDVETLEMEIAPDMKTVGKVQYTYHRKTLLQAKLQAAMTCKFYSL